MQPLILYTFNRFPVPQREFVFLLDQIPEQFHSGIMRFIRWEDRQASLFGKLLLLKAFEIWGIPRSMMQRISFNNWKRPILPGKLDFNISHSGEVIACIICRDGRIGIDIEVERKIHLPHFRSVLTAREMKSLELMEYPEPAFYEIWTKKESVIKAEGKGFFNTLDNVESLGHNVVHLESEDWYVHPFDLAASYFCHAAMDKKWDTAEVQQIDILQNWGLSF